jgi:hypothetical protein
MKFTIRIYLSKLIVKCNVVHYYYYYFKNHSFILILQFNCNRYIKHAKRMELYSTCFVINYVIMYLGDLYFV